jgi:Uma2 family endonuclease
MNFDRLAGMNEIPRQPRSRPTTQAAEGVPRLRWTLEEFERLTELGVFTEDDRIELIGGELVPMSPKGNRHEVLRDELMNWMIERLPGQGLRLSIEIGWRPGGDIYVEPDILVCPRSFKGPTVPASEVLLAIEVADSSLRFDTSTKARLYAALGIREYWVINAKTLVTRVHREPEATGYRSSIEISAVEVLQPLLVPLLAVKLADLSVE